MGEFAEFAVERDGFIDESIAAYRRDGYARLGRVLDDAGVAGLRDRVDAIMRGEHAPPEGFFFQMDSATGAYADLPYGLGYQGPSPRYRKLEKLERDPVIRAWIENDRFRRIAQRVLGERVTLYRAILFNKPVGTSSALPWHQDGGKMWGLDRDPELQIWTALDDADEESGCLEVVPKSHERGLATPLGGVIPEDVVARVRSSGNAEPIAVPVAAGDALLLHNLTWHRSGKNARGTPRRALSFCYLRADTRCTRRRRAPRVFPLIFGARDQSAG